MLPLVSHAPWLRPQIHDSTLASQLAHMVVPVLRNTSSAFAGKRVPIAEEISTGRCCDEVTYMAHPSAGMLYRMKLPIVSAAAAAPTSADVAYRSVCFRRPWVAQPPTVAVLDPLKPQRRGSDVSSSADAEGAQRPTVAIIAVLGSRYVVAVRAVHVLQTCAMHGLRLTCCRCPECPTCRGSCARSVAWHSMPPACVAVCPLASFWSSVTQWTPRHRWVRRW